MIRIVLTLAPALALPFFGLSSAVAEDNCTMISASNTGTVETRIIDGFEYTADSWDRTALLTCARATPFNSCAPLESAPECQKTETECVDYREGECAKYEETYVCNNADVDESEIELIDSTFTVIRDEVEDMCGELEAQTNCVPMGEQCIEGPETRMINGAPIYKDCWKTEKSFSCAASEDISTCDELREDETCEPIGETCLQTLPDGTCGHTEENFQCGGVIGALDPNGGNPECGAVEVCVGANCERYEDEPNTDFSRAAAYLNMLDEAAKDFQDNRIFAGEDNRCRKWPLGVLNCCSDSGLLPSIGLNICNEEEVSLVDKVTAGVTHYIGTYCSQKAIFVCIEKKRVYCSFGSKFARIVQQQGREQLFMPWMFDDKASQPICAGFTPEELASIDFEDIDLSEVFGDMLANVNAPDVEGVTERISQDVEDFQAGGFTGTVEDPQAGDAVYDGLEEPDNGNDFEYQTRETDCAAGYHGRIIEERTEEVDENGNRYFNTNWTVKSNTCLLIQTDTETRDCGGDWSGQLTQERSFVVQETGYKLVIEPWAEIDNACYRDIPEHRETPCEAPRLGTVQEVRTIRTYQVGGSDSAGAWQEEGPGCYTIETEDRQTSCPETYIGDIDEQRGYRLYEDGATSSYGEWTKVGDSCLRSDIEQQTVECSAGFEGELVQQRSFDERLNGQRINFSSWAEISNSCHAVYYNYRLASCQTGFDGEVTERQRYFRHQDGYDYDFGPWEVEEVLCSRSGIDDQTLSCPAPWSGDFYQERHWSQDQGRPVAYHIWETVADDCLRRETEARVTACNRGYVGMHNQSREYDLYRDGRRANYSSWTTTSNTCERGGTQTTATNCPAPWSGDYVRERTFTQVQGETPVYSDWTITRDSCTRIASETRTVGCGEGSTGSTTQERTYRLHRVDGGQDNFSDWTDVSSTCTSTGVETQTVRCPAPWAGDFVQERSYTQLVGSAPVYSAWQTTSDSCNQTQTETQLVSCNSGYSGATTETRTYRDNRVGPNTNYSSWSFASTTCTSTGSEDQRLSCPAPWLGIYDQRRTFTQLQGSAPVYAAWATFNDQCYQVATETQTVACLSGFAGATTERRQYHDNRVGADSNHTPWEFVSTTCGVTGFEERLGQCPALFPDGELTERRNWTQQQGQARIYTTDWYSYTQSCRRSRRELRGFDCDTHAPRLGSNTYLEERFYWDYRDGRPDEPYTPWTLYRSTCY